MEDQSVNHVFFEKPRPEAEERSDSGETRPRKPALKSRVPRLPSLEVNPDDLHDAGQRGVACVNLKLAGAPFHEIAKELGYASPAAAKTAYVSALASMYPAEALETLREAEAMRAEQMIRRSSAMAAATYLVVTNERGEEEHIANTDQLRWHEQLGKDIALHAKITGAIAPQKVEISADTQEMNQIVNAILARQGGQDELEADVFDIGELTAEVDPMGE